MSRSAGYRFNGDLDRATFESCLVAVDRNRGPVYTTTVGPAGLLAYIGDANGRGEAEYVVGRHVLTGDSVRPYGEGAN